MKKYIGELNEKVVLETLNSFLESNNFYQSNSLSLRNINLTEKGQRELTFFSHPKFKTYSQEEYDLELCHDYPAEKNRAMAFTVFFSLRGRGSDSEFFFPLNDFKIELDSDITLGDLNEKFCELFDKQLELVRYANILSRYKPTRTEIDKLSQNILIERLKAPYVTRETEESIAKNSIRLINSPPGGMNLLSFVYFMQRQVYFSDDSPISYTKKDSDRSLRAGWASLNGKRFVSFMFKTGEVIDQFLKKNKIN